MPLFKNPFSKKEGSEQFTSDLSTPEKIKQAEKELKKDLKPQKEKVSQSIQEITQEKTRSVEKDISVPGKASSLPANLSGRRSKSVQLKKIENIMQEDLEEVYFKMDEAHRRLLREEGERSGRQIESILASGKSVAVKILEIIRKWLRLIPGVNKFFIEQEAKIKTDKIIQIGQNK